MTTTATPSDRPPMRDTVSSPLHPFGLPMGSVRGIMALLILGYFWLAIAWPGAAVKLPLGHFFLLPLVFCSFALAGADGRSEGWRILPATLRLLVVGGTLAAAFYVVTRGVDNFQDRLTPDYADFKEHWLAFAAVLAGGFLAGHCFAWCSARPGRCSSPSGRGSPCSPW